MGAEVPDNESLDVIYMTNRQDLKVVRRTFTGVIDNGDTYDFGLPVIHVAWEGTDEVAVAASGTGIIFFTSAVATSGSIIAWLRDYAA